MGQFETFTMLQDLIDKERSLRQEVKTLHEENERLKAFNDDLREQRDAFRDACQRAGLI